MMAVRRVIVQSLSKLPRTCQQKCLLKTPRKCQLQIVVKNRRRNVKLAFYRFQWVITVPHLLMILAVIVVIWRHVWLAIRYQWMITVPHLQTLLAARIVRCMAHKVRADGMPSVCRRKNVASLSAGISGKNNVGIQQLAEGGTRIKYVWAILRMAAHKWPLKEPAILKAKLGAVEVQERASGWVASAQAIWAIALNASNWALAIAGVCLLIARYIRIHALILASSCRVPRLLIRDNAGCKIVLGTRKAKRVPRRRNEGAYFNGWWLVWFAVFLYVQTESISTNKNYSILHIL